MAITKNGGRQYPLVAEVDFTFADLATGVVYPAIDIPGNAVVVGGELVITTAFNTGTSAALAIGDDIATTRYASAIDAKAAARTALTRTGYRYTAPNTIDIIATLVGTAATAGAGTLRVQYVIKDRAQEVQPV